LSGVFLLISCESDIERINLITNPEEIPDIGGKDMEIIYSDSAIVRAKLIAPSIRQFLRAERPYTEFSEGIHVFMYNKNMETESEIRANYAIYYSEEKLWIARGNVIAENFAKGEKLNTEELFWDENIKLIYSNSFSRIENNDGTFYGQHGFEANQQFTNWKLKGTRGIINVKDEQQSIDSENP
jgi:LPS export ABC transporter protein LptC